MLFLRCMLLGCDMISARRILIWLHRRPLQCSLDFFLDADRRHTWSTPRRWWRDGIHAS